MFSWIYNTLKHSTADFRFEWKLIHVIKENMFCSFLHQKDWADSERLVMLICSLSLSLPIYRSFFKIFFLSTAVVRCCSTNYGHTNYSNYLKFLTPILLVKICRGLLACFLFARHQKARKREERKRTTWKWMFLVTFNVGNKAVGARGAKLMP